MLNRLKQDLLTEEDMLYDMMPKEALRGALLMAYSEGQSEDEIKRIIKLVNQGAIDKAFDQGHIGAL